ncbi:hypothetical protein PoB_006621500 [Plakobranchus ocellatus]|uniref:Uncharacterized protein n=1 Tax=Plakobranchus ocellatus TaxID=259542 RepID=A0AAV4D6L8_9GAST|nr:hypothetical protein PoB_006621500 [Plakobranchus ocellatus]
MSKRGRMKNRRRRERRRNRGEEEKKEVKEEGEVEEEDTESKESSEHKELHDVEHECGSQSPQSSYGSDDGAGYEVDRHRSHKNSQARQDFSSDV